MDFPQFSGSQRRNAVLHAERLQFIPGVDAPLVGSSFYQRRFAGLVLSEKDRLAQDFFRRNALPLNDSSFSNES
jgi:hypothetical protein